MSRLRAAPYSDLRKQEATRQEGYLPDGLLVYSTFILAFTGLAEAYHHAF